MRPAATFIVGQALALGLLAAFLIIPGNAVFLATYGAERLPYVYLAVAGLGALVSFGLTSLQSRLGLYALALGTTGVVAASIFALWALLFLGGQVWTAFGALVLFPLELQLGFVFIGAQAGRAFDIQELKRIFSRIVAAFVLGFMIGGFAAAGYAALGGDAVHLLAASSATAGAMLLLMLGASRHVPEPVHEPSHPADASAQSTPSLRTTLRVPLVRAVLVYQVLSAMGTQFVEYLLYDRAAARYSGTQALAGFMGEFSAVLNLVDLVVLAAIGGFLMSRFGLRYGLAANPLIVTALVAASTVVIVVSGPDGFAFFFLMGVARIADVTMADAASRTSVNATFKALPARIRLAAQMIVEGAGVPFALGLTALIILAINAVPGSDVTHVVIAAFVVCGLWSASARTVYRRYQSAVVIAARRRTLDGPAMDLDEPATREALRSLCLADDPRDVHVGMSLLARVDEKEAATLLRQVADKPSADIRMAVLDIAVRLDRGIALRLAEDCVRSRAPTAVLAGLRTLARLPDRPDSAIAAPFLDSDDPSIRAAAVGAVLARADDAALLAAVDAAAASQDASARRFAASVIAEAGRTPSADLLACLLGDPDPAVRNEAEAAAAALDDPQRVALLRTPMGQQERVRFLRACRYQASAAFCARVADELAEGRGPAHELVRLLNVAGWKASGRHRAVVDRLIGEEIERIETARRWTAAVANADPALAEATARLQRALAQEAVASGRRLTQLLGLVYDRDLMNRTARVLEGTAPGDAAMILESLDVLLAPEHRGPVMRALTGAFARDRSAPPTRGKSRAELDGRLRDMARDCGWAANGDWLTACIADLMRAAGLPLAGMKARGPVSAEQLAAGPA